MLSSFQKAFFSWPSSWITTVLCCLIILVSYYGDRLLKTELALKNVYYRAALDNSTHGMIGGLCWAIVESEMLLLNVRTWMYCLSCIFLAMFVDLDHFVAVGTFDLQKASHLPTRPMFHNTSIVLIVALVSWLLPHSSINDRLKKFSLMFVSSWLSHHLRDANRRGLWIHPFGHTPPFSPFIIYVGSILLLAFCVRFIYVHYSFLSHSKSLIDV